jgi:tetratricopeptide (TPR) repeat protein
MKRRLLVLAALMSCASACASSGGEVRANARVVQGESTPARLLQQGDLYAAVGDTTRAEQYFAAALDAGGPDALLVRRLIRVCVSDHRFRAALEYASDHLRRHPDDCQVRFARAAIEVAIDDAQAAKTDLEAILEREPNDANAHFALATVLRDKLDDAQAADLHFRRYLQSLPRGSNAEEARASLLSPVNP